MLSFPIYYQGACVKKLLIFPALAISSIAFAQFHSDPKEVFRFCIKTNQYEGVINSAGTVEMSKEPELVMFSGDNFSLEPDSDTGDLKNKYFNVFSNPDTFSCEEDYTPYEASIGKSDLGYLSDTTISFSFKKRLKYAPTSVACKRTLDGYDKADPCGVIEDQRVNIKLAFKDATCEDVDTHRVCHYGNLEIDADLNRAKQKKYKELASGVWDLKDNQELFAEEVNLNLFWEKMGVGILPEDFLYKASKDRNGSIVYEDASYYKVKRIGVDLDDFESDFENENGKYEDEDSTYDEYLSYSIDIYNIGGNGLGNIANWKLNNSITYKTAKNKHKNWLKKVENNVNTRFETAYQKLAKFIAEKRRPYIVNLITSNKKYDEYYGLKYLSIKKKYNHIDEVVKAYAFEVVYVDNDKNITEVHYLNLDHVDDYEKFKQAEFNERINKKRPAGLDDAVWDN
jgi:hypothetical protein